MKKTFLAALAVTALLMTPASAQLFIPIGPPDYTPQPDVVTPVPDTVVVTPAQHITTGSGSQADKAVSSEKCSWTAMNGATVRMVNVDANCTALSIVDSGSGYTIPAKTTRTPNPDLVTPQPDLCSQPGFAIPGGWTSVPC